MQLPDRRTKAFQKTDRCTKAFRKISVINYLKWASSSFAVTGGVLLASKTPVSGYGFIFLAMSSSHMLTATSLMGDKSMMCYSGALFLFVDCLGIYRWLLVK